MNKTTAIRKLKALLGKQFAYRENPKAPTADEREEKRDQLRIVVPQHAAAREAQTARMEALLKGDAEYQRLKAETKRLAERKDALSRGLYSHRIDVGTVSNGPLALFHIKFSGDNWQEVVDAVTATKQGA